METINTSFSAFSDGDSDKIYSETAETKSSEVSVWHNVLTGNYLFFLKSEEHGPIIVDNNFESGKQKFTDAFGKMLIFTSIMKMPEAKEKFILFIKEKHPTAHSDINSTKKEISPSIIFDIAKEAKSKKAMLKTEMEELAIQ